MFVLPKMRVSSNESRPRYIIKNTEPEPAPVETKLSPVLLSYWGLPMYSELPEEGEHRTEIMEEYLLGLTHLVRWRNISLDEAFKTAINNMIKDEEIERKFIEEDADLLPWWCYIDHTRQETLSCLARKEAKGRLHIIEEFFSSLLTKMWHFETLHRQHVATQFLDSLFLKLCQVQPGWMWRRLPSQFDIDQTNNSEKIIDLPLWVQTIETEEMTARKHIIENFFTGYRLTLEVFTAVEKGIIYSMYQLPQDVTIRSEMERRATVIQAIFRGYRVRQRSRVAE